MMNHEKNKIRINRGSTPLIHIEPEPFIPFDSLSSANLNNIIEDSMTPVDDLLQMEVEVDYFIMKPWIKPGSLTLVHGNAGVGKTFFSLSVALAVTRGLPIGKWNVETPVGCLYVDGEMSIDDMKYDLQTLTENLPPEKAPLIFLTSEIMDRKYNLIPDIEDKKWRDAITDTLKENPDIGLLILDNMSSLAPNLNEILKTSRAGINQWQLSLRRRSTAVIAVCHDSKKGGPRGTSAILDNINYAIGLKDLNSGPEDKGAFFQVKFTKKRRIHGADAESFPMMIRKDIDSGLPWTIDGAIGQNRSPYIIALIGLQMKQRDIAEALGCTEANVSQIKKKAIKEGLLNEAGIPTVKWCGEYKGATIESVISEFKDN